MYTDSGAENRKKIKADMSQSCQRGFCESLERGLVTQNKRRLVEPPQGLKRMNQCYTVLYF